MFQLKVIEIEDSLGVVLPDEVVAKLELHAGCALYLYENPNGYAIRLQDQKYVEEAFQRFPNALRDLGD